MRTADNARSDLRLVGTSSIVRFPSTSGMNVGAPGRESSLLCLMLVTHARFVKEKRRTRALDFRCGYACSLPSSSEGFHVALFALEALLCHRRNHLTRSSSQNRRFCTSNHDKIFRIQQPRKPLQHARRHQLQ